MMDKLKMQTENQADSNFKKLAALFPAAVTETVNKKGQVVRAIDKDVLMQKIGCTVVEGVEERYQSPGPTRKSRFCWQMRQPIKHCALIKERVLARTALPAALIRRISISKGIIWRF